MASGSASREESSLETAVYESEFGQKDFDYKKLEHPDYSDTKLDEAVIDLIGKYGVKGQVLTKTSSIGSSAERKEWVGSKEQNIVSILTAGSCNIPAERTSKSDIDVMVVFKNKDYLEEHLDDIKETLKTYSSDKLKFWLYYKEQYTNPKDHFKPGIPVTEGHEDWGNLARMVQLHWQAKKGLTLCVNNHGELDANGRHLGEPLIENLRDKLYKDTDFATSNLVPKEEGYELLLPPSRDFLYGVINEDANKIAKAVLQTTYALHLMANGDALGSYTEIMNQTGRLSRARRLGQFTDIIELAYLIKQNPKKYSFEDLKEKLPKICNFLGTARRLARQEISKQVHKFERSRISAIEEYFTRTIKELEQGKFLDKLSVSDLEEKFEALNLYAYDLLAFEKLPDKIKGLYNRFYGKVFPRADLRKIASESESWQESMLIRGKILNAIGKYDDAIDSFNEVLKSKEPALTGYTGLSNILNRAEIYKEKGNALLTLDKKADAEKCFIESLKLNPLDEDTWLGMSKSIVEKNRNASCECKLISKALVTKKPRDSVGLKLNLCPDFKNRVFNMFKNYLTNLIMSDKELLIDEIDSHQIKFEQWDKKREPFRSDLLREGKEKKTGLEELLGIQNNILNFIENTNGDNCLDILKYYTGKNEAVRKKIKANERRIEKTLGDIIRPSASKKAVNQPISNAFTVSSAEKIEADSTSNKYPAIALAGSTSAEVGIAYLMPALLLPVSLVALPIATAASILLLSNSLYRRFKR